MDLLRTRKYSKKNQYLISIILIVLSAVLCFFSVDFIGYRAVALILLLVVSVNAILFDIFPVLLSALLSAIIWNFFFIPPILTFHIGTPEDGLMFLMYFVIASINAVLTYKIREVERKERDEEEKLKTIKLYNTLLNSLSHELRTPVSTIIGAVDTLKESKDKLSLTNQTELLSQIDIASIRLNRQVENLLNMSRLESGILKLNLDWCDLNELIFSVVQKLSPTNGNHKIVFNANENLPLLKLDRGLIEQVFHNIIYNAIQYTPENSIIVIGASHQSDNCVISISDNGNGFPVNEMQNVFDKFYRLPQSFAGGSGLGLSISKGFIEAHNGKIKLENNKEGGAKFTITIPAETSFINNLKNV
ncbi:MAG: ATP-binding protein [Sediminibacterium sp.]|nr:ATP-binding protein [Sediminibacterium sp.]MDP3393038.1 ATP-binding protein [Sediminibacterium sp.]MDP3567246.1 ATP-binding protein [Sediminibacterium sp.]